MLSKLYEKNNVGKPMSFLMVYRYVRPIQQNFVALTGTAAFQKSKSDRHNIKIYQRVNSQKS